VTDPPIEQMMAPSPPNHPSKVDTMNRHSRSERTNVLVATAGLAVVLAISPLSTLMTAAVVITMVGIALTYRLTANPLQVVRAEVPVETPRPQRSSPRR
jgi:hypothetical protein